MRVFNAVREVQQTQINLFLKNCQRIAKSQTVIVCFVVLDEDDVDSIVVTDLHVLLMMMLMVMVPLQPLAAFGSDDDATMTRITNGTMYIH